MSLRVLVRWFLDVSVQVCALEELWGAVVAAEITPWRPESNFHRFSGIPFEASELAEAALAKAKKAGDVRVEAAAMNVIAKACARLGVYVFMCERPPKTGQ